METMVLMGSEDVRRAAGQMQDAAQTIGNAASSIEFALRQHQQFLDDWLARFADVLASKEATPNT